MANISSSVTGRPVRGHHHLDMRCQTHTADDPGADASIYLDVANLVSNKLQVILVHNFFAVDERIEIRRIFRVALGHIFDHSKRHFH